MASGTGTVCLFPQGPEAAQSIFSTTSGPPTSGDVLPACPCLQRIEALSQPAPIPLAVGSPEAWGNVLVCLLTQGPVTPSPLVSTQEARPGIPFSTGPSPAGTGWSSTLLPSQHPEATLIACTFNHSSRMLSWPRVPGRPFLSQLGELLLSSSSSPDTVTHTDPAGPTTSGSPTAPFTHTVLGSIAASTEPAVPGISKALFISGGPAGSTVLFPKGLRPFCSLPMFAQSIRLTEDLTRRLTP